MRVAVRVLLFVLTCAVVLAIVAPLTVSLSGKWRELAIGVLAAAGAFALTLLFAKWDRIRVADVGAAFAVGSATRFALGLLIGFGIVGAWAGLLTLFGSAHWVRTGGASVGQVFLACCAYVALATREELAFHGYPLRRLEQRFGFVLAQLAIALLFALEHRIGGASWTQALLGAGTGSLLFGAASLSTRGLAMPIGMHAAWNLGHWALGFKGGGGFWRSEGVADRTAMLLYVLVMASAAIAFSLRAMRRSS
jgi:membrane protease YdiL (CAAX protease family)